MPKSKANKVQPVPKSFPATLECMKSRLNWTIIHIPFDVAKVWGRRGQLRVKGEINGFAFRTSLFPTGQGGHILLVNKRMQKGARAVAGTVARFQIEPDTEKRVVTVPAEFNRILTEERTLRRWFDQLNHSTRNDIAKWVSEPKSPETRVRRAEQIAERMLATMEAERELPPILQVAFSRNPAAREGWELMTAAKRRGHLFGIFGYRTPESRGRRVDKMLDEASAIAEGARDRDR
ncbi:MAG: YdeI/OmpD-associated family protein [Acidobacteriia bacterium]|nr:YdeI/OmpD-associated family protein [Terriglobia bacterium]